MERNAVTIKDIARLLKISASTVSRALRNHSDIKKETKILVQDLAAKLNYSPDPVALSLKDKKSRIIGVIVPEIANNFCAATIAGIEDIAYSRGFHVIIFQSHEKYEREVTNTHLLASRRVDGLIISVSNETSNFDHLEKIMERNIPLVMFDRVSDKINTHKVVVNDYLGAYQATEHLIQQGYHDIAHLAVAKYLSITQHRLNGYIDALKKYNLPVRKEWIIHCNFNASDIENSIRGLFAQKIKPSAILASVERLATGCMMVLRDMGLRIPEDVALVGFSDNPLNRLLSPSLSAIRQPTFEIGQQAARLLIDLIENTNSATHYKTVMLDTILDIQDSSRRVNAVI